MKSLSTCAAIVLMLSAASLPLQSQQPARISSKLQQKFEDIDRKWQAAEKNGDVAYCEKFFADSYVLVKSNGEAVTKQQWLATLRSPDRPILEVLAPDDIQVHMFPHVVVLIDHTTIKGHDSKGGSISGEFRVLRVLLWQNGEWKAGGVSMKRIDPK